MPLCALLPVARLADSLALPPTPLPQQALATLAKMLRANHKLFAVAGTKDKRGVTAQQVRQGGWGGQL